MNNNKAIFLLIGIGITLYSLASYLGSKSPLDLFNGSLGVMVILFIFYNEDNKINYLTALFCVNIFQWIILIYVFFNNPVYMKTYFYFLLIGAPLFTIVLVNQIRKNHLKPHEKAKISMSTDKKKLILLFTGAIIIIGSLAGFIVYYAPIFLYGITLGLMTFTYGFYHEDKKVNVSKRHDIANALTKDVNVTRNYAVAMSSLLILQVIILCYFFRQISTDDWANAFSFSIMIAIFFSIQIGRSNLKFFGEEKEIISNEKKETIIGIFAIIGFILFVVALALK